jgi:hypothetical protein
VTFLLRNPAVFDQDDAIQKYVAAGKARLVKGDALVRDDCQKAWEVAAQGTGDSDDIGVDILLFTVGLSLLISPLRMLLCLLTALKVKNPN